MPRDRQSKPASAIALRRALAALCAALCTVALAAQPAAAETISFSHGKWRAEIDATSGAMARLEWDGHVVADNQTGEPTVLLNGANAAPPEQGGDGSGEAHGTAGAALDLPDSDIPLALGKVSFDELGGVLSLVFTSGVWRVEERFTFGAGGNPDRLASEASFSHISPQALKFKGFRYRLNTPLRGRYFLPGGFFADLRWREDNRPGWPTIDWSRREGEAASFASGVNDRVKFAFRELEPGITEMAFCDARLDGAGLALSRSPGALMVEWRVAAQGWCEPGQTQRLAAAWVEMAGKPAAEMLDENAPALLRDLGFTPPPTRPDWVADAAIYGIETEPFREERLSDIPETVGARMLRLGLDTCWYRPCEASTARYCPIDYRLIEPKIGSSGDYREANRRMHDMGLRVLQDIVPHGGGQLGFFLRGQSCSMQGMTERGDVLDGWSADFADPRWLDYMRGTCELYTGDLGVDGFRVDAIYGAKTLRNWRRKGWPSEPPHIVPSGDWNARSDRIIHKDFWAQSLALDGGEMPPLAYDRASLASAWGGLCMVDAMREGARHGRRDAALLLESGELPFTAAGDLHYDRDIQSLWFKLRALPAAEFVRALRIWLHEEDKVDAPGCIRMRYMETGDGESWPYRNWYGIECDKAIRALCAFVHGVPMFFENFTEGEGDAISELMRVRRETPALRRGAPDYAGVSCDAPEVLAFARRHPSGDAVVAINFSPDRKAATVTDRGTARPFDLPPFGWAVAVGEKTIFPAASTSGKANAPEGVRMDAELYSADGSRDDATFAEEDDGTGGRILRARSSKPCWIALRFPGAGDWELDTSEGILADTQPENKRPRASAVVKYAGKRRETKDPSCIWCGDTVPLDPSRPELRVLGNGGATLTFAGCGAGHCLYRDWDGETCLTYLARFGGEHGDFSATVRDGAERKKPVFGTARRASCGVEYRNVSTGWRVRFGGREATLLKANGVLFEEGGLGRCDLVADRRMADGGPFATASGDPESRVRMEERADRLRFIFTGEMRAPYVLGRNRLRLVTTYDFLPSGRLECGYALTPSGTAPVAPSVRFEAEGGPSHDFFTRLPAPLLPRRTYRFGFVSNPGEREPVWRDAAMDDAPPAPLLADSGFELRSSIVSLDDGRRVTHFEKVFDDSLPWRSANAVTVADGCGVDGTPGLKMAWCNPEFRQEVEPVVARPGRYRVAFDLKSSRLAEQRVVDWDAKVSPFHPFVRNQSILTVSLTFFTEDGVKRQLKQERKIGKKFDWRREVFDFALGETALAPEVSISLFNGYADESFIDNFLFAPIGDVEKKEKFFQ